MAEHRDPRSVFSTLIANPAESLGQTHRAVMLRYHSDTITMAIPAMVEWRYPDTGHLVRPGPMCLPNDITMQMTDDILCAAEDLEVNEWPSETGLPSAFVVSPMLSSVFLRRFGHLALDASGELVRPGEYPSNGTARRPSVNKTRLTLSVKASRLVITYTKYGHFKINYRRESTAPVDGKWTYVTDGPEELTGHYQPAYKVFRFARVPTTGSRHLLCWPAGEAFHDHPHERRPAKHILEALTQGWQGYLSSLVGTDAWEELRYTFDTDAAPKVEEPLEQLHRRLMQPVCTSLRDTLDSEERDLVPIPHPALNAPFTEDDVGEAAKYVLRTEHARLSRVAQRNADEADLFAIQSKLSIEMSQRVFKELRDGRWSGSSRQRAEMFSRIMRFTWAVAGEAVGTALASWTQGQSSQNPAPEWGHHLLLEPSLLLPDETNVHPPWPMPPTMAMRATWDVSVDLHGGRGWQCAMSTGSRYEEFRVE